MYILRHTCRVARMGKEQRGVYDQARGCLNGYFHPVTSLLSHSGPLGKISFGDPNRCVLKLWLDLYTLM